MAGRIALRSFQDTNARLFRIRCTMQVCTMVCGNTAKLAHPMTLRREPSDTLRLAIRGIVFRVTHMASDHLPDVSIERISAGTFKGLSGNPLVNLIPRLVASSAPLSRGTFGTQPSSVVRTKMRTGVSSATDRSNQPTARNYRRSSTHPDLGDPARAASAGRRQQEPHYRPTHEPQKPRTD